MWFSDICLGLADHSRPSNGTPYWRRTPQSNIYCTIYAHLISMLCHSLLLPELINVRFVFCKFYRIFEPIGICVQKSRLKNINSQSILNIMFELRISNLPGSFLWDTRFKWVLRCTQTQCDAFVIQFFYSYEIYYANGWFFWEKATEVKPNQTKQYLTIHVIFLLCMCTCNNMAQWQRAADSTSIEYNNTFGTSTRYMCVCVCVCLKAINQCINTIAEPLKRCKRKWLFFSQRWNERERSVENWISVSTLHVEHIISCYMKLNSEHFAGTITLVCNIEFIFIIFSKLLYTATARSLSFPRCFAPKVEHTYAHTHSHAINWITKLIIAISILIFRCLAWMLIQFLVTVVVHFWAS